MSLPSPLTDRPAAQAAQARWLAPAEAAAALHVLLSLALFIVGTGVFYTTLTTLCTGADCLNELQLQPAEAADLARLGLSLHGYALFHIGVDLLYLVATAIPAAIVYLRLVRRRTPQAGMGLLSAFAIMSLGTVIIVEAIAAVPTLGGGWALLADLLRATGLIAYFALCLLFPDGRFVPHWARWVLAATALWQIGWVVLPIPALHPEREIGITLSLIVLLTSLLIQIYRYRTVATPLQRQQTKWFLFGFAAGLLGVLGWATIFIALLSPPGPTRLLVNLIGTGVLVFSPLATVVCITIALLRFRLWEIDLVINRTLVYTAITVAIIAIYSLIVGGLGSLLHVQSNPLVAFVGAGVIALIFRPLADGVQQAVNRLMFGRRNEPYAVLAQLGHELQAAMLPEQGLRAVVTGITTSLKLPYAAIELVPHAEGVLTLPKPTDDRRPTPERTGSIVHPPSMHNDPTIFAHPAAPPQPIGALLELPLTFQGEALGRLLVAPRSPGEPFSPREQRLLEAIADQAGAAASAVQLTLALQRSRERLVLAREEERRRIRRDLHDELGPTLASQTLRLDAAIDMLDAQPDKAAELLTTIKARNQALVAEIRRLVYELRPPALDELGLVGALRAAVRQLGASTPQIRFAGTPDPLPGLPAAVEVAAYRIALEAITNAMRHAEAAHCTVRLELQGDGGARGQEGRETRVGRLHLLDCAGAQDGG